MQICIDIHRYLKVGDHRASRRTLPVGIAPRQQPLYLPLLSRCRTILKNRDGIF